MAKGKIIYQNWIVDIGIDPGQAGKIQIQSDLIKPDEQVISAVRKALEKLESQEQEFIESYYFQGKTYREIANLQNRRISRIEGLHRRSLAKLKKYLTGFVKERFDIDVEIGRNCVICESPQKKEINKLIKTKNRQETWKKIIKTLKDKYQIKIKTPQILIGHKKYHLK
ncbi:MAG: sigma-70 family RNA polymerase sigma factor [candidate division Zixibacteria bacterium]|nr:sigma-70 family RNA polymerase sigma factor [candidate division Zixibacteria bacterium]